ncbi:MAG: hypothetical protein GVY07_07330 [Bacteroidetes bacterium]|jgi:hypothetical protein|nr:hypothetical protein [Bacteroidota bacterium]
MIFAESIKPSHDLPFFLLTHFYRNYYTQRKKIFIVLMAFTLSTLTLNFYLSYSNTSYPSVGLDIYTISAMAMQDEGPENPQDCDEDCDSEGGLCNITLTCPEGSEFGFVGCIGLDNCQNFFDEGVVCDGILTTCW